MSIHSYPSVFAIGHKAILDIFSSPVLVEEKIDGSQFSMMRKDGELLCRSKGAQLNIESPEAMFKRAVEVAESLELMEGWIYRCEYLQKPKHNTLAYSRCPAKHLILFDVEVALQDFLPYESKMDEAFRLGLEVVPMLACGQVVSLDGFNELLSQESCLGGCNIEGVVVKNYSLFTHDKKAMVGKYVSESFKEKHSSDWKGRNPSRDDIVTLLCEQYRVEARWQKAIQHIRESGGLEDSPRDIGKLIKEVPEDIKKEEEAAIKDALFSYFWPQIRRGVTVGLPEWYKQQLAQKAFD